MRNAFLKLYVKAQMLRNAAKDENGQDLIEYALVVALVAFAATAGMTSLATGINLAFTNISSTLGSYIK
jgi:pilus assembly protein Flp/PilA